MDLSLQMLRIFCKVVEEKSFSGAARILKITQPTVSQQIARMESEVGSKLFERVGHVIHLTPTGSDVYRTACEVLEKTSGLADRLKDQRTIPSGLVRYAMPESCQWTPHYRKIMSQIREFPGIRFEISILPNDQIVEQLMKAEIDFGFIAGEKLSPDLRFEKFSDEHYSLVARDRKLFQPLKEKNFQDLRLISYPGWEDFFITWAKAHHLWKDLKKHISSPTVSVGTLSGAIHAAQEGAGVAVIPTHCVENELSGQKLFAFEEAKGRTSIQPIYLAKRLRETLPKRVELVMEMLKVAKKTLG